jgi:hypothetical protein
MNACALALVLLIDVSGSVSPDRYELQHAGIAQALTDPHVQHVLLSQPGGMAITVIEWSDRRHVVVPWHMVQAADDVSAVAETLRGAQRSMTGSTAMGDAMAEGVTPLDRAPCEPVRKVIDVSGDGRNNDGSIAPDDVRVRARARGITINGLPIITDDYGTGNWGLYYGQLDKYYDAYVIGGPGAFSLPARGFEDFASAIRRKLILEISGDMPPDQFAARGGN